MLFSKKGYFLIVFLFLFFILFSFRPERENFSSSKILTETISNQPFLTKKSWPEWPEFVFVKEDSLISLSSPVLLSSQVLAEIIGGEEFKNEIITHFVEPGESLWSISNKYGLKIETIVWANDLEDSIIKPGQELTILPVDGIIHIVKESETLEEIAERYKADLEKILEINELLVSDEIFEHQALIIPDGKMPTQKIQISTFTNLSTNNFYELSHAYPYGQCTWWVAQKRKIPSWGHAKYWLENAAASGYPVCFGSYCQPQFGAVISLRTYHSLGHVGYVERVEGDRVIFSEMNYVGWGKMNYRTLKIGSSSIKGYIY